MHEVSDSPRRESIFSRHVCLLAIVALALVLRVIGIGYGLPAVYNPDEVAIMSRTLAFGKGDLNPHNFLYPTLYFYVLFAWLGAYFVLALLTGTVQSLPAFQNQFFTDPTGFYIAGRLLGVLCGTAAVWVTYVLGRLLFDGLTGRLAALALAVAPYHVRDSHYVKHDVPATLAIVVAQLAIARIWMGERRRRDIAVAGVACGIAFSTHYYTIFLLLPLAAAVFLQRAALSWRIAARDLAIVLGIAALTFFACSPFLFVEPLTAYRDIAANRHIVVDRAVTGASVALPSAGRYLRLLASDAMGWPIAVCAALGGIALAWRDTQKLLFVAAFPVAFLLFISNTVPASRYLNPVLPTLCLLAGYAIAFASKRLSLATRLVAGERFERGPGADAARGMWFAAIIGGVVALPGLAASIRSDLFFRQPDTRTLAGRFIEEHISPGSTLLVQPYSASIQQSRESLRESLAENLGAPERASTKFAIRLALNPYPAPAYRLIFLGDGGLDADKIYISYKAFIPAVGLDPLRARGVQYVILKRYNAPDPGTLPFLDSLAREGRQLAKFSPYRPTADPVASPAVEPFLHNTDARIDSALDRPGPVVEIWRVQPRADMPAPEHE